MTDIAGSALPVNSAPSRTWQRSVVLSAVLSLLVLAVIAWVTHEPGVYSDVAESFRPIMLLGAVGIVAVRVGLGGWRIAYASHGRISLSGGIRGQLAWDFFSIVTPSVIGGAPIAAFFVARDQRISTGESTAIFLYLMVLDQLFIALTVLVVVVAQLFMPVLPDSLGAVGVTTALVAFTLILLWVSSLTYAAILRPELLQRCANWLVRFRWLSRFRVRVERESALLAERSRTIRGQGSRYFLACSALTVATWVVRHVLIVFAILCFQPTVDVLLVMLKSAALTLGSLVLPTPGGSGGIETLYALFVAPAVALPTLVPSLFVWRVCGYYIFLAAGAFLTVSYGNARRARNRAANNDATAVPPDIDVRPVRDDADGPVAHPR